MQLAAQSDYPVTGKDVPWKPFSFYEGFEYKMLAVDVERRTVEMILKFEPDCVCFYHRHLGPVASIVLAGEHHFFEVQPDGSRTKQIRTQGEFTMSQNPHAHIEGGGPEGGTIFFSLRCDQDDIYDIMDNDFNVIHEVTVQDFKAALDEW